MQSVKTDGFPISALDREGPGVPYTGSLLHRADRNRENAGWLASCRAIAKSIIADSPLSVRRSNEGRTAFTPG